MGQYAGVGLVHCLDCLRNRADRFVGLSRCVEYRDSWSLAFSEIAGDKRGPESGLGWGTLWLALGLERGHSFSAIVVCYFGTFHITCLSMHHNFSLIPITLHVHPGWIVKM